MTILVTGADSFIGRHLVDALSARDDVVVMAVDASVSRERLEHYCAICDFVFHLAGAERPRAQEDFMTVNYGFTDMLLKTLARAGNACPIMYASSPDAALPSLYGKSKKAAEELFERYVHLTGAACYVCRLPIVFGREQLPSSGCPVAALCQNAARGESVLISEPDTPLLLSYIDDVIDALCALPDGNVVREGEYCAAGPAFPITAGALYKRICDFYALNAAGRVPDLSDPLSHRLYITCMSYLPPDKLIYPIDMHQDGYGSTSLFLTLPDDGQVRVNVIREGISEAAHCHNARVERHIAVAGTGVIRILLPGQTEPAAYDVSGAAHTVVLVPTGCAHSVESTGSGDLIDVVWASAVFDPDDPDTF